MKIGIGTAFIAALLFHGALLATLVINVSLEKPKRPEEKPGKIIHATVINIPPAKGTSSGKADAKPPVRDVQSEAEKAKEAAEAARRAELARQVEAQRRAEEARQKAIALRKAEEEKKKKAEEEKKRLEEEKKRKAEEEKKRKAEEEAKRKAEEEERRLLEEQKKKAQEEAKRKAEEEKKRKAEAEAKRKAEAEAKRKAEAEAKRRAEASAQAQANANALEDDLLGSVNGVEHGQGLGSGDGSDNRVVYGGKVQQLIEQNWRIDPSMNGKQVVVTLSVDNEGNIFNEKCQGDRNVCASALSTIRLIGLFPRPPKGCKDCGTIVITMTPKI